MMKYIVALFCMACLSGCALKANESYVSGENFGKDGRCGTVNTFGEVKQWGCLWNR